MLTKNILILFLLFNYCSLAQIVKSGETFSGNGMQTVAQTYIDKLDNRYHVVFYNTNFIIDSIGTPITISINPATSNSLAILKFDVYGKYLYHLKFNMPYSHPNSFNLSLAFDLNNDLIVYLNSHDSIDLIDSRGLLFRRLITPMVTKGINVDEASIISKVSQAGIFMWVSTLTYKNSKQPRRVISSRFTQNAITINNNNEICIHKNRIQSSNALPDTLSITDFSNFQTKTLVFTEDMLLKFSNSGTLILLTEPFRFRFTNRQTDPIHNRIYRSVTDGVYTYSINRFYISTIDTFKCSTPIPMPVGENFLLIKMDKNDSIIWAKHIGTGEASNFVLDYNPNKQELIIGFTFLPYLFQSPLNAYYNTHNIYDLFVGKLDTSGNFNWYEVFLGNDREYLYSLTYNLKSNQVIAVGYTTSNNFKMGKYSLPQNGNNTYFISIIDSSNIIYSAETIKSKTVEMSPYYNYSKTGYPITNAIGETFISGSFTDSVELPCNTLKSFSETVDGFVLLLNSFIPKDTSVCVKMVSPSGKYIWDSIGVYYDTIPNSFGCDSLLLFKVKTLQSKSILDTLICKKMISYSGKYTWDSSGIYMDTIPNAAGCDSIITVKVTLGKTNSQIDTVACFAIKSPSKKYIYDSSGTYYDTIPNYFNCDSVITLNVIIQSSKSIIDTITCGLYLTPSGKSILMSGSYLDTIPNSKNCDSIITINFIHVVLVDTLTISACNNYTSPSGRYIYAASGMYQDTIQSILNCDSILVIKYTKQSTSSTLNKTVCDKYILPSRKDTIHQSGIYLDTIPSSLGCDSIISILLTVKPIQLSLSKSNDISCDSLFTTLKASEGYTYSWTPIHTLSNASIENPIATPSEKMMYTVSVSDGLGCSAIDSIEVQVNKQETLGPLANVFTPNGDGKNDCLLLQSIGEFKTITFDVYNRWGQLVFSTTDPTSCWDGKVNNEEAASGTYFFVFNGTSVCNTEIQQSGAIQLIR